MNKAIIYTDGGARGNPGPAAIGAVIEIDKNKTTVQKYIGEATNNIAEYTAVVTALEKALELKVQEIELYLDSELVQQQLVRKYKVKNPELAKLFVKVWNLQQKFEKVTYTHIRREKNKEADALVNQALDQQLGK